MQEEDRKYEKKIKGSESGLLFSIVHPEVFEVKEPEPVAEDGDNAEDEEKDERRSFPRH